jgi:hypothetical protein
MLEREDSPWYPQMRLFRQTRWGEWCGVFERIAAEIRTTPFALISPLPPGSSPGELFEKIAILEIARSRAKDDKSAEKICVQLGELTALSAACVRPSGALELLTARLWQVNEEVWRFQDELREHEERPECGERFVELAKAVMRSNADRTVVKRQINELVIGAPVSEQKLYTWEAVHEPVGVDDWTASP